MHDDGSDLSRFRQLDRTSVDRLVRSLISDFQLELVRTGSICSSKLIDRKIGGVGAKYGSKEDWELNEENFGFDSLSQIDVASRVAQFFGLARSGFEDRLLLDRSLESWSDIILRHYGLLGDRSVVGFRTSGSSGKPKIVEQAIVDLLSEAHVIDTEILKGVAKDKKVVSSVPPHHIYGFLWAVLMPQLGNREVIFVPSGFGSSALSKASSGDIILGTPMTWEHSADFGVSVPEGVTAVSSGGPTRSETWDAAQRLGVSRFVDVFGSSETGGIGWRDASESAYYLYSDISNSNDQLRRSSGKILELQDHFRWVTDRTFFLEGRKDDVVQVGGVNVSIGLVRSRILELDEVAEVAVRMGRDRLKAFVVPHRSRVEMGNIRDRIYRALADLPATSRPATVTLGTSLPRNSMGKLSDWDND